MTRIQDLDAAYFGDAPVDRLYMGDTLLWEPPAPGGFSPLDIPWFRASWAELIDVSHGSVVPQWNDETGNGWHYLQDTPAKQATLDAAHPDFNGKKALVFDGVDDYYKTAHWPVMSGTVTHVIIGRANNLATNSALHAGSTDNAPRRQNVLIMSNNKYRIYSGTANEGGSATTNVRLFVARFATTTNPVDSLEVDGTEVISGNSGSEGLDALFLGVNNALTNYLSGAVAWSSIINRALTTEELANMLNWSQSFYTTP